MDLAQDFFIIRVALPLPLRREFDYLPLEATKRTIYQAGLRVKVPFGSRQLIGIIIDTCSESVLALAQLKTITTLLDEKPLPPDWLKLAIFTARYYQAPLGETLFNTLPVLLRRGATQILPACLVWRCTAAANNAQLPKRAAKQRALLTYLQQYAHGLTLDQLQAQGFTKKQLHSLMNKGLVTESISSMSQSAFDSANSHQQSSLTLTDEQQQVLQKLQTQLNQYACHLLYGVTGSGKTEIYLRLIAQVLRQNRQALILVPEISLTPQTLLRFQARFMLQIVMLHSGLTDRQRLNAWLAAANGTAAIIIGTRSAIFTPMANLGIIIVDEEHDLSFKQQEGLHYHARDLAVYRAQTQQIPIILGSATPSLESLAQVSNQNYQLHQLTQRPEGAQLPQFELVDLRVRKRSAGINDKTFQAIRQTLAAQQQVLVFINRRGFAPALNCQQCGHLFNCQRCDARLTLHHQPSMLICHHCEARQEIPAVCPQCQSPDLHAIGTGTERTEQVLQAQFPHLPVLRIDRDSTKYKNSMQKNLTLINSGQPCILVGTQILAKGHHFPQVTLVVIVDADAGLWSSDFRALEQSSQLLIQVAGRAGRETQKGRVILQTFQPDNSDLLQLIHRGYLPFANRLLIERRHAALPPYHYLALLRAQARTNIALMQFLSQIATQLRAQIAQCQLKVLCLGPVPAPMERRYNRYHGQLLLNAPQRSQLHQASTKLIHLLEKSNLSTIRWSLDIDPMSLF